MNDLVDGVHRQLLSTRRQDVCELSHGHGPVLVVGHGRGGEEVIAEAVSGGNDDEIAVTDFLWIISILIT